MSIEIKLEKDVDPVEWNSVLNKSGYSLFQSYEWSTLDDFLFLTARENGKLCGGCLLVNEKLFGMKMVISWSAPFGLNSDIIFSLLQEIKRIKIPIKWMKILSDEIHFKDLFLKAGFSSSPVATYVIDLKRSEKEIRIALSENNRWEINKARSYHPEITQIKNMEDIKQIYLIYVERCRIGKTIPRPLSFFAKLYENIIQKGLGETLVLTLNGRIVSFLIMLFSGSKAIWTFGMTKKEFQKIHMNYLLLWESILRAKKLGFNEVDLLSYNLLALSGSKKWKENMFKDKWGGHVIRFNIFFNSPLLSFAYNQLRHQDYLQPFLFKLIELSGNQVLFR